MADKNGMMINPGRSAGEPTLPETGILFLNPGEAVHGARVAEELGGRRHFLFNSNLFVIPPRDDEKSFFVAGPAVGAPMAVLSLEKLVALGARRFLVFGWCGSLTSRLVVGDALLPTWGASEEGVSQHYPLAGRPESSPEIRRILTAYFGAADIPSVEGPIWTTDAPYRESKEKVCEYGGRKIMGVDMEFSALCTVAAFRGVEMAAVSLVSDELWRKSWAPGYKGKSFKKRCRQVVRLLVDCCRTGFV